MLGSLELRERSGCQGKWEEELALLFCPLHFRHPSISPRAPSVHTQCGIIIPLCPCLNLLACGSTQFSIAISLWLAAPPSVSVCRSRTHLPPPSTQKRHEGQIQLDQLRHVTAATAAKQRADAAYTPRDTATRGRPTTTVATQPAAAPVPSATANRADLIRESLYVMQGIDGEHIKFQGRRPHVPVEWAGEEHVVAVEQLCEVGMKYKVLKEYVEMGVEKKGRVWPALQSVLQHNLF